MARGSKPGAGVSEALRAAVDRTYSATAGPLTGTRERASELLDDVVRRGERARDDVVKRGERARDAVADRGQSAIDAVTDRVESVRAEVGKVVPDSKDLRKLESELAQITKRLEDLEKAVRKRAGRG